MKSYGILTKLSLKQYFGLPQDKKARRKKLGLTLALGLCFIPIIVLICVSIYSVGGYALLQGKAQHILGSIMMMSQVIVLFFGSAAFMSIMYYSKDNEFLNTLPVKPLSIFLSKFTIIYLSNILISLLIVVPSMITIAISSNGTGVSLGAEYYIFGLLGSLFTPMIPLLLVSVISMPLAYLGKFFKRYQMLSTIVYLLLFVGFFVGYMLLVFNMQSGLTSTDGAVDMTATMDNLIDTFAIMSKIIYPNLWLATAMVGQKIAINVLLYFGIIIAISALAVLLAAFMYKRNSLRFLEVAYNKNAKNKVFKAQSQVKALVVRDMKLCLRDTSLAINCLLGLILAPLMVGMFSMMSGTLQAEASGNMYTSIMAFTMGVMMLAGTNYIANISISREGEKFYMVKYMPISVDDYIKSKRLLSMAYILIGSILVAVVGGIATKSWIIGVFLPINSMLFGTAMSELGIYRDLKKPMLNWISVKQILKQRTSTLVPMLFGMVEAIVFVVIAVLLSILAEPSLVFEILPWAIMTVINVVLMILLTKRLSHNKYKLFDAIEANNG